MTIKEALHQASKTLASGSIEDAPLEAELLLMHLLGIERARLYARLEQELPPHEIRAFDQLLERRLSHEPIAYILGHREFFGYDFCVAPGVLIPRPESELLVEKALDFVESEFPHRDPVIAEIGTGCGAIAITLALLLPQAKIYATDVSPCALGIARVNCDRHGVANRVHLLEGDLLDPLPEHADIIIANLPYIRDAELSQLSAEVRMFEPGEALSGGEDGLEKVRPLLGQAQRRLQPGDLVLVEIGAGQGDAVACLAKSLFPQAKVELARDLGGRERVLSVRRLDKGQGV